jgi:hypothetical protein
MSSTSQLPPPDASALSESAPSLAEIPPPHTQHMSCDWKSLSS